MRILRFIAALWLAAGPWNVYAYTLEEFRQDIAPQVDQIRLANWAYQHGYDMNIKPVRPIVAQTPLRWSPLSQFNFHHTQLGFPFITGPGGGVAPPPTCSGRNFFVKNGGSNSNSGTSDILAWAGITKVNTGPSGGFIAGDCINFHAGNTFSDACLNMTQGGNVSSSSTANSIIIQSYSTGTNPFFTPSCPGVGQALVQFNGVNGIALGGINMNGALTGMQNCVLINGGDTILLSNVDVTGCNLTSTTAFSQEVLVTGNANNWKIIGSKIHGNSVTDPTDGGVYVNGLSQGTGYGMIIGNEISNIGGRVGGGGFGGNGIEIDNTGCQNGQIDGCTVQAISNVIHDIGAVNNTCGGPSGILVYDTSATVLTNYNEVSFVRPSGTLPANSCDWDGIDFDGGTAGKMTMEGNYIHNNCGIGMYVLMIDGTGVHTRGTKTIRYNISENDYTAPCLSNSGGMNTGFAAQVLFYATFTPPEIVNFYNNILFNNNVSAGVPSIMQAWGGTTQPGPGSIQANNIYISANGTIMTKCDGIVPRTTPVWKSNAYNGTFNMGVNCTGGPFGNLAAWQAGLNGGDTGSTVTSAVFSGTLPAGTCAAQNFTFPRTCPSQYQLTHANAAYLGKGTDLRGAPFNQTLPSFDMFGDAIPNSGCGVTGSAGFNIGADAACR